MQTKHQSKFIPFKFFQSLHLQSLDLSQFTVYRLLSRLNYQIFILLFAKQPMQAFKTYNCDRLWQWSDAAAADDSYLFKPFIGMTTNAHEFYLNRLENSRFFARLKQTH